MTNRIGNKDEAHQRGKEEKARIKASNIAQEAVKKAAASAKYRNEIKGQPRSASTVDTVKSNDRQGSSQPAKEKAAKRAPKTEADAKSIDGASGKAGKSSKDNKSHDKAGSNKGAGGGKKQERKH